jgi:hypothetical protein
VCEQQCCYCEHMRQDDGGPTESHLRKLETDLLEPATRHDSEALSSLLAEEFCEFGSSGRIYTRQQVIDALGGESVRHFSVTGFSVTTVASGVALVRYQARCHNEPGQGDSTSLRSSLWVRRDNRWQMLFHQGTKADA